MNSLEKINKSDYNRLQRDRLSDFARYERDCADSYLDTISFVGGNLARPEYWQSTPLNMLRRVNRTLALDSLEFLHANYTAGDDVENLAKFFPVVVSRWEKFGDLNIKFQQSDLHHGAVVAHASFWDGPGYFDALRLICLAYLLGHASLIPRIKAILDYGNPTRDCLIERLLQPFGLAVDPLPDDSTRELPYRNTIKIFNTAPADRPPLMQRYLEKWYHASRRECYYDTHKGSATFLGYWSFESGALTYLLDIDDSSYRDHEFYPKDMVDFARSLPRPAVLGGTADTEDSARLRCPAGEPCPQEGYWHTPAKADSLRFFKAGEIMPRFEGDYGETIWQQTPDQSSPK